jgi:uncharacterized protein
MGYLSKETFPCYWPAGEFMSFDKTRCHGNVSATCESVMSVTITSDPVLRRFREALGQLYGNRLERVVLYGSRARGNARADSDYDVAVFLRDMDNRDPELYRLADLSTKFIEETGEFVHAMPYRAGAYDERTPIMREIRREGIDL